MSHFLKNSDEYNALNTTETDFDDAVKLPGGGSTCDIYRTRRQRREVFIKRLKEEYRSKPLYLDALDKEFDIGVNLRHPSLPFYREFHRDYIVLDYIDGETLAEIIKRKDPWLTNEKHIVGLLRELVDVTGYLHRHNVVHCDIKPDNIMITANSRNAVLIDFDKCYTHAMNDTSGHPERYGVPVEKTGCPTIDFHGIAMVVEKLKASVPGFKFRRYNRFVKACYNPDVTADVLSDILDYNPTGRLTPAKRILLGLFLAVATLLTAYYFFTSNRTVPVVTVNNEAQAAKTTPQATPAHTEPEPPKYEPTKTAPAESVAVTQQELHTAAQQKAAILDKRIQPAFNELLADLDSLENLTNDTTITPKKLFERLSRHYDMADECVTEAFAILYETFPGTSDREAWRIMGCSKAYTGYKRQAEPRLRKFGFELESRSR